MPRPSQSEPIEEHEAEAKLLQRIGFALTQLVVYKYASVDISLAVKQAQAKKAIERHLLVAVEAAKQLPLV